MKVLFVDQFGKTTGRDTLALAELLNQKKDIEMNVLLADTTELPENKNYSVNILYGFHNAYTGKFINKVINYLKSLRDLDKYIRKNKIDILHLQWFSLPWIEWLYVAKWSKKSKVVITVHDIIPFDKRPLEMKSLDMVYKGAHRLLVHTHLGKETFKKNYTAKTPVNVITQGFCLKSDYPAKEKAEAKGYFKIPGNAVVILYYGTIRPSKGLDILMKSILKAHKKNKDVYLLGAGAFHNVDEEYYKKMEKEIASHNCGKINFGFVPYEEEQWYFSAADILCLPYLEITQSGVAQLGLMYELPIISTNIGEMADVVRDSKNGRLIQAGNETELTKAILELAGDEKTRKSYSKESKILGETEFSLNVKAARVSKVYRKLFFNDRNVIDV